MQRAIYNEDYVLDGEDYLFYLPGFHAVKTKDDIRALIHFPNTVLAE